jgi:hypothetical protein
MTTDTPIPEAKAKVRQRRKFAIRHFEIWLQSQKQPPSRERKYEMFDFFIDRAAKGK